MPELMKGGHSIRVEGGHLAELGGDGAETDLEVEGGHSGTVVVEAKLGTGGVGTELGVVEERLLLEVGTRPGGSRRACLLPRRSRLRRRS